MVAKTRVRIQRVWWKYKYYERPRPVGVAIVTLLISSCTQATLAGLQGWQSVEVAFAAVVGLAALFAAALWILGYLRSRIARYIFYWCGSVTVTVAVIGDVAINRNSLKFGEIPTWFAAIGTVGALTVSLKLLIGQANERRSAQARLVCAWVEELQLDRRPFPVLIVLAKNGSDQAIYGVGVSVAIGVRGTFYRYLSSLGPGELREVPIPLGAPPRGEVAPDISFVDGAGMKWIRTADVKLYNPTSGELLDHTKPHPGAYDDISQHPTLDLQESGERYRSRRRQS